MKQRNRRSLLGALGATVAAGALALGGAVAANAEPTENWPGFLPDPALKDNGGSITLTKLRAPDNGQTIGDNDGSALTVPEGSIPINGVGYTLWKTTAFDLMSEAGWQAAQTLQPPEQDNGGWKAEYTDASSSAEATFAKVGDEKTTGDGQNDGVIKWEDLAFGVYILQETSAPGNVLVNPKTYYITVPMTNPAGTAWMYNVNVYPKDLELTAEKSVNDLTALSPAEGWNTITWTIDVPAIQFPGDRPGSTLDAVILTDQLPAGVDWTQANITVTATPDTPNPVVSTGTDTDNDGKVTVTWGEVYSEDNAGKAAALLGKDLKVTITAKVVDFEAAYGALKEPANTATIDVYTDSSATETATITTNTVKSQYAGAQFNKVNEENEGQTGAVFSLYASRADAVNTTKAFVAEGATSTGSAGTVTFTNLKLSDWAENTTQVAGTSVGDGTYTCVPNTAFQVYWLVETQAPTDYELLPQPIPVQLVKGDGETYEFQRIAQNPEDDGALVWETEPEAADQECKYRVATLDKIENVEHNAGFNLPLTGGWGTVWLMVAGGVLLGLVLVVARRRRAEEV